MNWFLDLLHQDSVAHSIAALGAIIAAGLALGHVRIFGVSLGVAGVLFAGLLAAHLGLRVNPAVLEFTRELGLVFFVFTIGLQLGPGFFASLRRQGLALNLMAAAVVLLGAGLVLLLPRLAGIPLPAAVGIFSGATTNTPSLAAAGQALRQTPGVADALLKLPDVAYAVTYPFGILGTILAMLAIRRLFRVDLEAEKHALRADRAAEQRPIETLALRVTNPNLTGVSISRIPALRESEVVVSRISRAGTVRVATPDTRLAPGDELLLVGPPAGLESLRLVIGETSSADLRSAPGSVDVRRVLVTSRTALGKSVEELDLARRYGVNVTRIARGDQQFTPTSSLRLQFADTVTLVGPEAQLAPAEALLGNSPKELNQPNLVAVFVGILLGVLLGTMPLFVPGLPAPVKLGLAGGPLIVAILLGRLGHWGPLVWYMPPNANYMLREIGIALFLAAVGLKSGDSFWPLLSEGDGLRWMLAGAVVTVAPLLLVALAARALWKLNYIRLCGLLAGSMTDPPALAFASTLAGSEDVAIAYVTVYPLTMLLRVFAAQWMVLFLLG
ncbi:MAG: putative transporter [Opitutaceae bacterium]|nr:putative transporter [Opitutaceae bacterium]